GVAREGGALLNQSVARRGRPVSRDALIEALWPEEDPALCANRLSVALSTLRGVLDPERGFAADHFVVPAPPPPPRPPPPRARLRPRPLRRVRRRRRVARSRPRGRRPRGLPE